ncbi:hypothetical protein ACFWGN_04280 [Oerskovia sp. NPDC060338]|uniref:hypothetical protein n=1 Tax=Oerskovia sp. NPDC060338 TaxID=3347100 RepID=UPI00365A459F
MANGDAAAAAGMDVVPGTADRRTGYDEINKTRDYIADVKTTWRPPANRIDGLRASAVPSGTDGTSTVQADLDYLSQNKPNKTEVWTRDQTYSRSQIDAGFDARDTAIGNVAASVGGKANAYGGPDNVRHAEGPTGGSYTRQAGSNRFAVWMDDGLLFGRSTSSERYKDDIRPWDIDPAAVLAIEPVGFHRHIDPEGVRDHGAIAEQLDALGLSELVYYDDQGRPDGIRDHLVVWALLAVVRTLADRITHLEDK